MLFFSHTSFHKISSSFFLIQDKLRILKGAIVELASEELRRRLEGLFLVLRRFWLKMASREAMEESKATSLYHAPTLRPGIGSPRCPRCSAPLSKDLEASGWTIAPFMRESFAMVGTAAGGSVASFYAFNAVMPHVKTRVGGPIWWQFVVGLPPVLLFSVGCAGLAGGSLPALAQLAVSTYHTASASSHSAISGITMRVEERGTNSLVNSPTPSQKS